MHDNVPGIPHPALDNWHITIAEHGHGHLAGDVHVPSLFRMIMRDHQPLMGNFLLAGLLDLACRDAIDSKAVI